MDFSSYIILAFLTALLLVIFDTYFVSKKLLRYKKSKTFFRFKFSYLRHYFFLINILILTLLLIFAYLIYIRVSPQIQSSVPETEGFWEDYSKPVEINFNVPVSVSRLKTTMNPLIKGHWKWEPYFGIKQLTMKGKFYAEETLLPDERIVFYITGIGKFTDKRENNEGGIVFHSVQLPEVKATSPLHKENHIETDTEIKLLFNKNVTNLADLQFKLNPSTEIEVIKENDKYFILKPKIKLQQSTTYHLIVEEVPKKVDLTNNEVLERDNSKKIHDLEFTTLKEPFIKNFTPKGSGVRPDSNLLFRFEVDMDRESFMNNLKIEPEIVGDFVWQDNRTLSLAPKDGLKKDTKYKVTVASGVKSMFGGLSERTFEHEFETIGKVNINNFSPNNGESRVNINTNIEATFDQEVDKENAQSKFTITPNVNGSFRWDGNKVVFDPDALNYGTTYTITFKSGIKSLYGIDSEKDFSFSFTTRNQQIVLSLPWYAQPQSPVSFTCNIVSAQMVLASKGFNASASGLINEVGYNSNHNGTNWTGNPYKEFVGCADGYCGYGIYPSALQKLFSNRGINTEIKSGWNVSGIARSIENGNPVIIWRYSGTSTDKDSDWVASDGTYIDAINGQHGGVVTGFRGPVESPTAFYINDPWFGLIWMDINTFDYYWSRLNRLALIIY